MILLHLSSKNIPSTQSRSLGACKHQKTTPVMFQGLLNLPNGTQRQHIPALVPSSIVRIINNTVFSGVAHQGSRGVIEAVSDK